MKLLKNCSICKLSKPLVDFHVKRASRDGRNPSCKSCRRETDKSYRVNYRLVINERLRQRWVAEPKHREAKLKCAWRGSLRRLYNISVEFYDALLLKQNGVCAICHKPEPRRKLAVDHDHKTGVIRGLLCVVCNAKVAWFEEDLERMKRLLDYVPWDDAIQELS